MKHCKYRCENCAFPLCVDALDALNVVLEDLFIRHLSSLSHFRHEELNR